MFIVFSLGLFNFLVFFFLIWFVEFVVGLGFFLILIGLEVMGLYNLLVFVWFWFVEFIVGLGFFLFLLGLEGMGLFDILVFLWFD